MTYQVDDTYRGGWTGALRRRAVAALPPDRLLPDRQPAYVSSWIYVFGVLTIAALIWVLVSGVWLALAGAAWWHTSTVGHFVNSLHLWSVELFFSRQHLLHLFHQRWLLLLLHLHLRRFLESQ